MLRASEPILATTAHSAAHTRICKTLIPMCPELWLARTRDNSYPIQFVPKDNSCPGQLIPKTTCTRVNSYPRQLLKKTIRIQGKSCPGQFVPVSRQSNMNKTCNVFESGLFQLCKTATYTAGPGWGIHTYTQTHTHTNIYIYILGLGLFFLFCFFLLGGRWGRAQIRYSV